ncbi:MAG: type II toxin-antitoxin system RelE/ParE family toxin [Aequorivita sp.]|nr:type II toxin-antitoxin system RelE/ParE family toxin [Aequorivita sp.]
MKLIWTDEAEETFSNILLYLASEFSERVADKFYNECYKILGQIKKEPFLYRKTEIESVHKVVIHKFTTLYYRLDLEKNVIVLLFFFDTRQNPNLLSFNS